MKRTKSTLFFRSNSGNSFAYVYRCNIYFKPSVKSDQVFPITTDGKPGKIFNGIPDWVYEGNQIMFKKLNGVGKLSSLAVNIN